MAAAKEGDWWRQRGGHELYDIFAKIEAQNPMAARAFWNSVVGRGRGENDLMAATIHKKFGGDMNAYNNWRNAAHHGGYEGYEGNFDLATGKWKGGSGYNQQYLADRGVNAAGDWAADWAWGDYKKNMQLGLQSTPGNEEAGAEAWKTYGAGAHFGLQGAQYPGVAEQANIAATGTNPYAGQYNRVAGGQRPGMEQGVKNPGINLGTTPATQPNIPVPNPTNTGAPSAANPYQSSSGGGYRFFQRN
jgi:hypothetical protein